MRDLAVGPAAAVVAAVDPAQVFGLAGLGALFGYTRWLIVRSDRALDDRAAALARELADMRYDRDFWRARALGEPPPPRPAIDADPPAGP